MPNPSCIVICGPTASGKSEIADGVAEGLSTYAILVDSMQVYREVPSISNQTRRRFAHLCGVTSIKDRWSVAKHRDAVLGIVDEKSLDPVVLDAGTGMYLNAILLDIDLAPEATWKSRKLHDDLIARARAASHPNPRREARRLSLEMSGGDVRGSIWEGSPRFDTCIYYLKPRRDILDENILKRSKSIFAAGLEEASYIEKAVASGEDISPSVADSIGVRELRSFLRGEISEDDAIERIATRTRQLSRRQMTWFDKLAKLAPGIPCETVTDYEADSENTKETTEVIQKILTDWNRRKRD